MFGDAAMQRLYRYAYALTGQEADAYDLLQGTLERLLRREGSPVESVAYARAAMRNAFIDDLRRAKKVLTEAFDDNVHSVDFGQRTLEDMVVDMCELEALWPRLKPGERDSFSLGRGGLLDE